MKVSHNGAMRSFLLFLFLMLPATLAGAQQIAGAYKLTTNEELAIIFYKTAGKQPPFESWIRKNEPYKSTAPALRPSVLQQEKQRLAAFWQGFDLAYDTITIAAKTTVSIHQLEADAKTPYPRYELHFDVMKTLAGYFPYAYLDQNFAVIPERPEELERQIIPGERYAYLKQLMPEGAGGPYTLIIRLSPTRAAIDELTRMEGKSYWPLLVKVASLSLWNENGALIWETSSSASLAPPAGELLDLKQNYRPYQR